MFAFFIESVINKIEVKRACSVLKDNETERKYENKMGKQLTKTWAKTR